MRELPLLSSKVVRDFVDLAEGSKKLQGNGLDKINLQHCLVQALLLVCDLSSNIFEALSLANVQ